MRCTIQALVWLVCQWILFCVCSCLIQTSLVSYFLTNYFILFFNHFFLIFILFAPFYFVGKKRYWSQTFEWLARRDYLWNVVLLFLFWILFINKQTLWLCIGHSSRTPMEIMFPYSRIFHCFLLVLLFIIMHYIYTESRNIYATIYIHRWVLNIIIMLPLFLICEFVVIIVGNMFFNNSYIITLYYHILSCNLYNL